MVNQLLLDLPLNPRMYSNSVSNSRIYLRIYVYYALWCIARSQHLLWSFAVEYLRQIETEVETFIFDK
jgi:hypothetical protein